MKISKRKLFRVIKILIAAAAVINLIALFVFHYELPAFLQEHFSKNSSADGSSDMPEAAGDAENPDAASQETSDVSYSFRFESDPLIYDGTTQLELLSGVSLVGPDGPDTSTKVFAHITTGDTFDQKIIEYTADTADGQISASRGLTLVNYSGPSISLPDSVNGLTEDQLNNVLSLMPDDGSFCAYDGYGNDITSAVTAEYSPVDGNAALAHYVFSVTNSFNDTVSAGIDYSVSVSGPVIVLTQSAVTIPTGSAFQPLAYVQDAVDSEGNSLFHRISIDGQVDVNTPGIYTLTFTAVAEDGQRSQPKELTVTVE